MFDVLHPAEEIFMNSEKKLNEKKIRKFLAAKNYVYGHIILSIF